MSSQTSESLRRADAVASALAGAVATALPALEALEARRLMSAAAAVGPDAFGYRADAVAFEDVDLVPGAPGVTGVLDGQDDAAQAVDLAGNTFRFYGNAYGSLYVSSNGLITFGGEDSDFSNSDLRDTSPFAAIAPMWDDWVTFVDNSDQVLYQFQDQTGDGTADRLVVEWNDVYTIWGGTAPVTFQAILQLNTESANGDVVFNYRGLENGDGGSNGAWATIGVKDEGGQGDGGNRLVVSVDALNDLVGSFKAIRISRNDAPLARDGSAATDEDTPAALTLGGVDYDGDALAYTILTAPQHGTLAGTGANLVYTPDKDYFGPDGFTYRASDGTYDSGVATVSLTVLPVNDAPVAAPESFTTAQDARLDVPAGGVLGNDADAEGDALQAVLVSGPKSGTLTLNADGSFGYVPAAGFSGTDAFTYAAGDGSAAGQPVTVTLTVTPAPKPEPRPDPAPKPGSAQLVTDEADPSKQALVVYGTGGRDEINVVPAKDGGVEIFFGGLSKGVFKPTGRIVVYAGAGDDRVQVAGAVAHPAWLYGGDGDDRLNLGNAGGFACGGAGDDRLMGGTGRDILVGGAGGDSLNGNGGDDLLIGGETTYDGDAAAAAGTSTSTLRTAAVSASPPPSGAPAGGATAAWSAIAREWNANRPLAQRVANLAEGKSPQRLNGSYVLNASTVKSDGSGSRRGSRHDAVCFNAKADWFVDARDQAKQVVRELKDVLKKLADDFKAHDKRAA